MRLRLLLAAFVCVFGWNVAPAGRAQELPFDQGAAGAWQKLRKLPTTASAMHTTAHPDDEHGGVLTKLSRGQGARVSLLSLTRGESGDNAIGPELFDGLGLIRTEELRIAGGYYGLDAQYYGTVADYGYSKRLDEALEKWGREHVLRDVVGIIRTERPLVVFSRFQGNARDGHGNHSAAGMITQEAFKLAGDPKAFPDQIAAGLRPWQPLKLYRGGVRPNEDWTLRVDAGEYDPVLGESYQTLARLGLSFQRSQTGGRFNPQPGPSLYYYERVHPAPGQAAREMSFFDGIDTTIPGVYGMLGRPAPSGADVLLLAIDRPIRAAIEAFDFRKPSASAPALAEALRAARAAAGKLRGDADVAGILERKAAQIEEALHAVLGVGFTALAQPAGAPQPSGPFASPAAMPPVVPGQTFEVRTTFVNRSPAQVADVRVSLESSGKETWTTSGGGLQGAAAANQPVAATFRVTVPEDAALTRPYFSRGSINDARYDIAEGGPRYRPWVDDPLHAVARYEVEGVPVELREPVTRLEPDLPYGFRMQPLAVVPAIAVVLAPGHAVTPIAARGKPIHMRVEVLNNVGGVSEGQVKLSVPQGWTATPASHDFRFSRAGERAHYAFEVSAPSVEPRDYRIEAVASSGGREYRQGYATIRHRDLDTRYLYRDAVATVRGIEVTAPAGLEIGYVMGIGDDVPSGLAQLGAKVQLLGEHDLAASDLDRFDAILVGTRAYAVREDLRTYNRRLLDYAERGGNLIVLYNTQELVPELHAPYPAQLPGNAEEVSEEDSPVEILAPDAPVLNVPNRITRADFDGWMEQRGSKFWSTWDERYTPVIATWDTGQEPQKGGWLYARYGKGHYTYFAYAFHRQLPYGVAGAYRLLANLLALSQEAR